jgi:hypothetical protein
VRLSTLVMVVLLGALEVRDVGDDKAARTMKPDVA